VGTVQRDSKRGEARKRMFGGERDLSQNFLSIKGAFLKIFFYFFPADLDAWLPTPRPQKSLRAHWWETVYPRHFLIRAD
jgi:hypothetical protein